jgi:hypothetical protein
MSLQRLSIAAYLGRYAASFLWMGTQLQDCLFGLSATISQRD